MALFPRFLPSLLIAAACAWSTAARADTLLEELRAGGELPAVVAALDGDDVEGALRLLVEAVPTAAGADRERLREVAVALFEQLGSDDSLATTYRRRLAAALY